MSDFQELEQSESSELSRNVRLRFVALPLAGNRRHQWQALMVLSALSRCRGQSATVEQLHTLVWALSDERNATAMVRNWGRTGALLFRGYVPDLLQLLRIMQVEDLIAQESAGRQKIAPAGAEVLSGFLSSGGSLGPAGQVLDELTSLSTASMSRNLGGNFS